MVSSDLFRSILETPPNHISRHALEILPNHISRCHSECSSRCTIAIDLCQSMLTLSIFPMQHLVNFSTKWKLQANKSSKQVENDHLFFFLFQQVNIKKKMIFFCLLCICLFYTMIYVWCMQIYQKIFMINRWFFQFRACILKFFHYMHVSVSLITIWFWICIFYFKFWKSIDLLIALTFF